MGMTTVLNVSGVDKAKFLSYTEEKPATYEDWSRTWTQVSKTADPVDDAATLNPVPF